MAEAAEKAERSGVRSMVGFTYRRVPAIALARQLVRAGRIGQVRHVRAQYLQDWIADPEAPLSWRLVKERAGHGALGDIGAHIVDLTQFITGDQVAEVSGYLDTFVTERPLPTAHSGLSGTADATQRGAVTVDDAASFLARFTAEHGRLRGHPLRHRTQERHPHRGERCQGSLAFDFEDMNVLNFFDAEEDVVTAGFRRILVTEPDHPYVGAWWPPGHLLGYEHAFSHQVVDLVRAIDERRQPVAVVRQGVPGAAGA